MRATKTLRIVAWLAVVFFAVQFAPAKLVAESKDARVWLEYRWIHPEGDWRGGDFGNYQGQMKNGGPHGYGRYDRIRDASQTGKEVGASHVYYEGFWANGVPHGSGVLIFQQEGLRSGSYFGRLMCIWYVGNFLNGHAHGEGVLIFRTDSGQVSSFTGEWKKGVFHGEGIMQNWHSPGDGPAECYNKWVGEFRDGYKYRGLQYRFNAILEEEWSEGVLVRREFVSEPEDGYFDGWRQSVPAFPVIPPGSSEHVPPPEQSPEPPIVQPPEGRLPAVPALNGPGSTSASDYSDVWSVNAVLGWYTSRDADYYVLVIDKYPYGGNNLGIYEVKLTDINHWLPDGVLEVGGKYSWRVRAGNDHGESAFSAPFYFHVRDYDAEHQVPQSLPHPAIIGPGVADLPGPILETLTPTLRWEEVDGAASYTVRIFSNSEDWNWKDVTGGEFVVPAGTLDYGESYKWHVTAHWPDGEASRHSHERYFQTAMREPKSGWISSLFSRDTTKEILEGIRDIDMLNIAKRQASDHSLELILRNPDQRQLIVCALELLQLGQQVARFYDEYYQKGQGASLPGSVPETGVSIQSFVMSKAFNALFGSAQTIAGQATGVFLGTLSTIFEGYKVLNLGARVISAPAYKWVIFSYLRERDTGCNQAMATVRVSTNQPSGSHPYPMTGDPFGSVVRAMSSTLLTSEMDARFHLYDQLELMYQAWDFYRNKKNQFRQDILNQVYQE